MQVYGFNKGLIGEGEGPIMVVIKEQPKIYYTIDKHGIIMYDEATVNAPNYGFTWIYKVDE